MNRLKWDGLPGFQDLRWTPLDDPASLGVTGAFYKTYKNFAFYWILKAGHMVRHWLMFLTILYIQRFFKMLGRLRISEHLTGLSKT